MEQLTNCPACSGEKIGQVNEIEDHFLSRESFGIYSCAECGLLFTNPRPEAAELPRYYQSEEYLSHTAARKGIVPDIYKMVRNISLRKKHNLITGFVASGKILDVGCGTGEFLNFMNGKGWDTTGIEPAEEARNFAIENYKLNIFAEEKISELPSASFDVITLWHVLEHVPDLQQRITQLKRLLKDNGLMVFALPNHESMDAAFYQNFWAAWDVPRHLYHFSQGSFAKLMHLHKMKIVSIRPMKFDAFYVSLLSEKYKHKKTNFLQAIISGLKSNISAIRNRNNYSSLIYLVKNG